VQEDNSIIIIDINLSHTTFVVHYQIRSVTVNESTIIVPFSGFEGYILH